MKIAKLILLNIFLSAALIGTAQNGTLMEQMKSLQGESDPSKAADLMKKMIINNKLDTIADSETIDVLKGTVAMAYLNQGNYTEFEKQLLSIRNKFNQTSYLSMAVSNMVRNNVDLERAEKYAKQTLDLYASYKDDTKAKPADMDQADWNRFMRFAFYPYNDTYAMVLHARGKYKEALEYQVKAFNDSPEEGISSSVERYADLLAKNGKEDKAYDLLTKMAKSGKSTQAMNDLLKDLYVKKEGSPQGFEAYFADLQESVVAELKKEYKGKMMDTKAPEFTLMNLKGEKVALADFRGKVVVLDFWATWCQPCIASFPSMIKAMEKHPDVVFLYIATQENPTGAKERVAAFIRKNNYPFMVLMDEHMNDEKKAYKVVSAYKPKGIPAKAIIDGNGIQRFLSTGFSSDTELLNELEAMIALAKEAMSTE